jgi:H+/Cl- antiporter ClcA
MGMQQITDDVLIVFGVLGIAAGILGKEFYAADIITLHAYKQKQPAWLGRLVCIVVGVGLIAIGIKLLLGTE